MSELYVDTDGLNGLNKLLVRASGDAADTLTYVNKHCDLTFIEQGLLGRLVSPHKHAFEQVTQSLTQMQTLTQGAAVQIDAAQLDYAKTDQAAASRVDRSYPGAHDPAMLYETFTSGRPDLRGTRTAFTDMGEPAASLRGPEYAIGIEMWSINPLADLISPSAWLRQVCITLFSYDPLEGWASQFAGTGRPTCTPVTPWAWPAGLCTTSPAT